MEFVYITIPDLHVYINPLTRNLRLEDNRNTGISELSQSPYFASKYSQLAWHISM